MQYKRFKDQYIKIFTSCHLIKGANRSCIYDIQRENYDFIPNGLYDILLNFNNQPISKLYKNVGSKNIKVVDEYLEFLLKKEF